MSDESEGCELEIVYKGEPVHVTYKGHQICVTGGSVDDGTRGPIGANLIVDLQQASNDVGVGEPVSVSVTSGQPVEIDEVLTWASGSHVGRVRILGTSKAG
jgi:hypothetical protein